MLYNGPGLLLLIDELRNISIYNEEELLFHFKYIQKAMELIKHSRLYAIPLKKCRVFLSKRVPEWSGNLHDSKPI